MPLTDAQYRAHVMAFLRSWFSALPQDEARGLLVTLIRQGLVYKDLGADQKEAMQRLAQELAQDILGRALTADELHLLRFHWVNEAQEGAGGTL